MEYLMTYGWAILIIAVVLGVLYYIGVFNGSAFLGTSCIASSGFICSSPVYSHSSGNIVIQFGQQTGSTWSTAVIAYVNQTADANVVAGSGNLITEQTSGTCTISGGLIPGQIVTVALPASAPSVKVGTSLTGYIWVQYTVSGGSGSTLVTQVGTISAKAS